MDKRYKVSLLNGFVELNTLSPNTKFYYKITKPTEVAMGVYACSLAFFSVIGDKVLYFSGKNRRVSYLPPFKQFEIVVWLQKGEIAFFISYHRTNILYCILFLDKGTYFEQEVEMKELEKIHFFIQFLNEKSSISESLIESIGFKKVLDFDKNNIDFKENWINKWYPKG